MPDDLHALAGRMGSPGRPHLDGDECRQVLALITEVRDLRAEVQRLREERDRLQGEAGDNV